MSSFSSPAVRLSVSAALIVLGALATFACGGGDGDGNTGPGPSVASVTVAPTSSTVGPGETVKLTASAKDGSGAVLQGHTITWSSDDNAVATVSDAGIVTGVAEGTATVIATSEGKSGQAAITVTIPVASVEVAPSARTIRDDETVQLAATVEDVGGNPLTRTVTWSSTAPAVATVSATGLVTGIAAGTATIKATASDKVGAAAITVRVLDVSGDWSFSEAITDAALGLTCTDQATMTMTQTGASFTGTSQQTGTCTLGGTSFDNSGAFDLTDGHVKHTEIGFLEPGAPTCQYTGSLTADPPTGASGTVSCTGEVAGLGQVNATGSWQITR